jgi:undecaprenyl-diphosphatase
VSAPVTVVNARGEIYRRTKFVQRVDLFAAGFALVALVLFSILTALVIAGRTAIIDHDLILSLRASASPVLTAALLAVTFASGKLAIPAATLFALLISRRDGWRTGWYYVAACVTAQLLNAILKLEIHRARPHGISPKLTAAGGLAYPSADAMMAVVIFGLGTLVLSRTIASAGSRRAVRCVAVIFVVAAAIARVYLGAHWPSDVLGGLLAGVTCAALWVAIARSDGATLRASQSQVTESGELT